MKFSNYIFLPKWNPPGPVMTRFEGQESDSVVGMIPPSQNGKLCRPVAALKETIRNNLLKIEITCTSL